MCSRRDVRHIAILKKDLGMKFLVGVGECEVYLFHCLGAFENDGFQDCVICCLFCTLDINIDASATLCCLVPYYICIVFLYCIKMTWL